MEKSAMQCSGSMAGEKHHYNGHRQRHARAFRLQESEAFAEEFPAYQEEEILFFRLVRYIYDTTPNNPLLFGTFLCVTSSTLTPLFSFLLSGLFFEVSNGGRNTSVINPYGDIVLVIAATEGLLISVKIAVIDGAATKWVTRVREACCGCVLAHDHKTFNKPGNAAPRLMQGLINRERGNKLTPRQRPLPDRRRHGHSRSRAHLALACGWLLMLVGFVIQPLFTAGVLALQVRFMSKGEVRKRT